MIDPVVKEIVVPATPEGAFRRFTEELRSWWPMPTHSVSQEDCRDVRFEGTSQDRADGESMHLVEEDSGGEIHVWGTVRAWDPPRGFTMSWHPGRGREEAQELDISFHPEGDGTRVRLVHRGWEVLGERGREVRGRYDEGWMHVLEIFVASGTE
jgi:hypothetical protein